MLIDESGHCQIKKTGCVAIDCTQKSTYGPYCPQCLREKMPHGSFAIVDQTGKGKALQTLVGIESECALRDIPYIDSDPEVERQGHRTHLMSTAQLEVLYGCKDSPGEKTVVYEGSVILHHQSTDL